MVFLYSQKIFLILFNPQVVFDRLLLPIINTISDLTQSFITLFYCTTKKI